MLIDEKDSDDRSCFIFFLMNLYFQHLTVGLLFIIRINSNFHNLVKDNHLFARVVIRSSWWFLRAIIVIMHSWGLRLIVRKLAFVIHGWWFIIKERFLFLLDSSIKISLIFMLVFITRRMFLLSFPCALGRFLFLEFSFVAIHLN